VVVVLLVGVGSCLTSDGCSGVIVVVVTASTNREVLLRSVITLIKSSADLFCLPSYH